MNGEQASVRSDGEPVVTPSSASCSDALDAAASLLATDAPEAARQATAILRQQPPSDVVARGLLLLGSALYQQGRHKEALEPLLEARDRFTTLGQTRGVLDSSLALARTERDLGHSQAAVELCDEAVAMSRRLADFAGEADALNLRASVWEAMGQSARALDCLERALTLARENELDEHQVHILNNVGSIYTGLGDHARALESLTAAYLVVQAVAPGTRAETANLIALGSVYGEMGDREEARALLARAREVSAAAGDELVEAAALNNLACLLSADSEWATARGLFEQALEISRRLEVRTYEIDNLDGLGQVHVALGEYAEALEIHTATLGLAREIGDREGELDALLNLGRDYLAMARPTEAIEPLERGLALASQGKLQRSIYQAHELLASAFEKIGDTAAALRHFQEFYRVEKGVFNDRNEERTRKLAVKFELERARHEAEQYRLRVEVTQQARVEAERAVRERTKELEEAQLEVVTRLAVAAEFRDDETGEHTRRVGRNAAAIARFLGWRDDEADLLYAAARLHDVGKIGISDSVLLKPGKLDADEFELIRTHTTIGARILSGGRSRMLQLAEEIALAHHERWDGKGYPFGLAAEQIPESARIVAVADVLDALTHSRPYKRAWPLADALEEIESQAGKQFDPRVVEACREVLAAQEIPVPPSPDVAVIA